MEKKIPRYAIFYPKRKFQNFQDVSGHYEPIVVLSVVMILVVVFNFNSGCSNCKRHCSYSGFVTVTGVVVTVVFVTVTGVVVSGFLVVISIATKS